MSDLISRDALRMQFAKECHGECDVCIERCQESGECMLVVAAPAVDAAPVVHAKWNTNSDDPDRLICSRCGRRFDMYFFDLKDMPYCMCGAKMDGGI